MNQEAVNLIFCIVMSLVGLVSIATLIMVAIIYKMHNVKNENGEYAWMIPRKWCDLQAQISNSQEKLAQSMTALAVHNERMTKVIESLGTAILAIHEDIKKK